MGRDFENRGHLSIVDLLRPASCLASIPDRNGDRVTGELSRGNELPNVFLEGSRWLKALHENILQARQHRHDFSESGRDTWRNDFLESGRNTRLSQRIFGERPRYLAQSPWIGRDSLPQEIDVRVLTTGCSRWHLSSKLVANIDGRCRGPLSWKGEASRC